MLFLDSNRFQAVCIVMCSSLAAQYGSTPINGHNPVSNNSNLHKSNPNTPQDGSTFLGATYSNRPSVCLSPFALTFRISFVCDFLKMMELRLTMDLIH